MCLGMFPYTMLATTTIFYSNDWPKRLSRALGLSKASESSGDNTSSFIISKLSPHCIYDDKIDHKNENRDDNGDNNNTNSNNQKKSTPPKKLQKAASGRKRTLYHNFFTAFTIFYLIEQSFLPYSHFITKVTNYFFFIINCKTC